MTSCPLIRLMLMVAPVRSAPELADGAARARALDVDTSFIVRAPAGSGKTRLLIQRYLALLACADEPEEVIAITFTRKAASEMRARVQAAFASAAGAEAGGGDGGDGGDGGVGAGVDTGLDTEVDTTTRALAQRALARDAACGWRLGASAQRLRIMTIDSLNASLTRQMSMASRFGAQPDSLDDASSLYLETARALVAQVNTPGEGATNVHVADDVAMLLTHLDNNLAVVEGLIADMLRSRDHWLRNLNRMDQRASLEGALVRVRERAFVAADELFPSELRDETLALMRFSGQNLLKDGVNQALSQCADIRAFPDASAANQAAWLAVADLLLTKEGEWRKPRGVNKSIGFPTSTDRDEKARLGEMKSRAGSLLESFAAAPAGTTLADALSNLRMLPPAIYSDAQWQVLGAIVRLLPRATAMLWNVFGAAGQCDFTEISQAASRALGEEDAPTDLALSLDYRIRHLLVDEFQDTSFAQFELLEKLTRGWSDGDGRTLFVVGDPMQSIYRFREAEVGLFLRAKSTGIGSVALEPITLGVNFRSTPAVVDWVNRVFQRLMPASEVAGAGVVPYSPSEAVNADEGASSNSGVFMHWNTRPVVDTVAGAASSDAAASAASTAATTLEARQIVELIKQSHATDPAATIAILVRNRSHLSAIVPALKAAGIVFRAVDIDALKNRPVVQDLLALTRALLHLADRVAWLSVLRAPWCGLTLNDLAALVDGQPPPSDKLEPDRRTIWEILHDPARLDALSEDGQVRLARVREVLGVALGMRGRLPLREAVERVWLALGGPACLRASQDLSDARTFLDLLETEATAQGAGGQIADLVVLQSHLDKLFSGGQEAGADVLVNPVQIMTIHKAKGLEFDTVIVPGLERPPRNDDKRLMLWSEQADPETGASELLLAPIRETGGDDADDDIYRYIARMEREKQRHEDVRLLYVAATRAKQHLHLFASLAEKSTPDGPQYAAPRAGSLMASLWPAQLSPLPPAPELNAASLSGAPMVPNDRAEPSALIGGERTRLRPYRISHGVPLPALAETLRGTAEGVDGGRVVSPAPAANIDFNWAGDTIRHVGTVVHAMLQRIAEDGLEHWSAARISAAAAMFEYELARRGVPTDARRDAVDRIVQSLIQALEDPRGRWILTPHDRARSEWRLTGVIGGSLMNAVIDRTFVDESGVRWIIDFKTGSHEGTDADAFLDNEQRRYRPQLDTYAALIGSMAAENGLMPIKCGLYFPMLRGWREW